MPARVLQSSFYTTAVGWDTRTTWQPSTLRHPEAPSKECLAFQLGLAWPLARGSVFPHQEPALSSYQGVYQWSANTVPNLGNRNPYQATPLTIPSPSSWTRALLSKDSTPTSHAGVYSVPRKPTKYLLRTWFVSIENHGL